MPINNFDDGHINFEPEQQPQKSNKGIVAAMIALSVVVVLVLGAIVFMFFGNYMDIKLPFGEEETTAKPTTEQVTATVVPATEEPTAEADLEVPYVVGMTANEAYDTLNYYGVKYTISREYSEDVKVDHVISQTPEGGRIKSSEKVIVVISKGIDNPPTTVPTATSPNATKKSESGTTEKSGDYIISGSDSRYISASEVRVLSKDDMTLALNEIYARHGRQFVTPEIQAYFNSKSWYHGTIPAANFDEGVLSTIERTNVNTIVSVMQEFGYR